MSLLIGHGNGHNRPELVDYARALHADSFSGQEAHRLIHHLDRIPGHRVTVAGRDFDDPRARSTCILTRSEHENLGELTRKVSEAVPGRERIAPDRVLVASFYDHPIADRIGAEGIAHFALHPDAAMMRHRDPDHPIVREYIQALLSAHVQMEAARADGLALVLTGDLQAGARFRAPWGPRELIAGPLNLRCRVVDIDWIMVDRRLQFAGPLQLHRLFDHTGFLATLKEAGTIHHS